MNFDDRSILSLRGEKNPVDSEVPYAYLVEKEYSSEGQIEDVATIFLTNSECPFRCLMCDLWKNTTDQGVKQGDIPGQIRFALDKLGPASGIKLYNSGNFFDQRAIPREDYGLIAELVSGFKTVTIECHPKLIGNSCLEFAKVLNPQLEVAIGLETIHPEILPVLNKRMELPEFKNAVSFLNSNGIKSRTFILLRTPFMTEEEGIEWAKRSLEFAFDCGVECAVVIPTRPGNGAIDYLGEQGLYERPLIQSLEEVLRYGIELGRGRVFADLWDIEDFSSCNHCLTQRKKRIMEMNLTQNILPMVDCNCRRV